MRTWLETGEDETVRIGLAGDWHGNRIDGPESIHRLRKVAPEIDTVYQLGDFGIWPGRYGTEFVDAVQGSYRRADAICYVTPGNHDDYSQINKVPVSDDGLQWIRPNVALIPRGHRWELGGRSFVSLGGAPSVDFTSRQPRISWWKEEMITKEEAQAVADAGYADIMLAHDSPDGGTRAVQRIIDDPMGVEYWGQEGIAWARVGRKRMNTAYYGVKPKLFAHGHYHTADFDPGNPEKGEGAFLSLDMNGTRANLAVLDLETWEITIVDPYQTHHRAGLYPGHQT